MSDHNQPAPPPYSYRQTPQQQPADPPGPPRQAPPGYEQGPPGYGDQQATPPQKPRKRIFLWFFLAVQVIFLIWIIAGAGEPLQRAGVYVGQRGVLGRHCHRRRADHRPLGRGGRDSWDQLHHLPAFDAEPLRGTPGMDITRLQPPACPTAAPSQQRPSRGRHRALRIGGYIGSGVIGAGVIAGCSTHTVTTPGPTITSTVEVSGPAVTVTASPAPPPSGTALGTWSGTGNENTPAFGAPQSGDYVVSWTYSNNADPSMGGATNFSISSTDPNASGGNLPNDIATSGSGSTEITGVTPGNAQSFNVQATGKWTIKVVSAP